MQAGINCATGVNTTQIYAKCYNITDYGLTAGDPYQIRSIRFWLIREPTNTVPVEFAVWKATSFGTPSLQDAIATETAPAISEVDGPNTFNFSSPPTFTDEEICMGLTTNEDITVVISGDKTGTFFSCDKGSFGTPFRGFCLDASVAPVPGIATCGSTAWKAGCGLKCCDEATNSAGPECYGTTGYDPDKNQCCDKNIVLPKIEPCPEVCTASTDPCMDKDSYPGVAVCTYDEDGKDYHNYCDTDLSRKFIVDVSEANGRPVVECGCCADDGRNIKRSKKGKHCDSFYGSVRLLSAKGNPCGGLRNP